MRRSKRISNIVQVATAPLHLLDLPRKIPATILSFAVLVSPASKIYGAIESYSRLLDIALLSQVCRAFRDILFSTPAIMKTLLLETVPGDTRLSRSNHVKKGAGSSFMMFFKRINCKDAIRTIVLDYEKILTLPSVFVLLGSCPNLEVVSLKEYSGFTPQDFLQYLQDWVSRRLSKGSPLLNLKEVDLSRLGQWAHHDKGFGLKSVKIAEASAQYWATSGPAFVEQVKKILDSVSKGGVLVKPATCSLCSRAVIPYEGPMCCAFCELSLVPVCGECQTYKFCRACHVENLGSPEAICQDCADLQ
jgi:hypothetical protein